MSLFNLQRWLGKRGRAGEARFVEEEVNIGCASEAITSRAARINEDTEMGAIIMPPVPHSIQTFHLDGIAKISIALGHQ